MTETLVQRRRALAIAEVLTITIVGAPFNVVVKLGLRDLEPLILASGRLLLGALILAPWVIRDVRDGTRLDRPVILRLVLIGLIGYAVGDGLFIWGLKYVGASTAALLTNLSPMFALLGSGLWLAEFPNRWQSIGTALVVVGTTMFFWGDPLLLDFVGIGLILAGEIAHVSFPVLARELARSGQIGTPTLTALPLAIGGLALGVSSAVMGSGTEIPVRGWGIMLWLAIVNTAILLVLYNHSLKVLTAIEVIGMLRLTPIVTALFAWMILGEHLSNLQLAGIFIAVVAAGLVQQSAAHRVARAATRMPES